MRKLILTFTALMGISAHAAVRLTAVTITSTDAAGKIQGVGAHRFKTTQHGGQPAIFMIEGDDPDGAIFNGPNTAANSIDLPLSAGTRTFTVLAEKSNSYLWNYYTLNLFFDNSNAPQVSALAAMNTNSTLFFPPFAPSAEFTENLQGYSVKGPNTLLYKSGPVEVRLTAFHFSTPSLYNKDRVAPLEVRANRTMDYVGQFTLEVIAPPEISAGGVVNAASFLPKLSPGSLFSIFGNSLATQSQNAGAAPLPANLAGTSVTVGGKPAPLVFVSAGQINAQVPFEVQAGASVPVVVTVNGVASPVANVAVMPAAPGIFQWGQKRAVAQNADYTLNTAENGAQGDSWIVAYLTGAGELDRTVGSGQAAPSDPLARARASVTATVDGRPAEIAFAGLTPQFVGLMQVNLKVPPMTPGSYALVVSVNGEKSNATMITVK